MYKFKLMMREKLKESMISCKYITLVTLVAFLVSLMLDKTCQYLDKIITPDTEIPTFVINLDNAKRRLSFFNSQLSDYIKFSAVDWREISIVEDEYVNKEGEYPSRMTVTAFVQDLSNKTKYVAEALRYPDIKLKLTKKYLRKNDIGCFFSHLALWNECYKYDYDKILVFEDDVVLKPFFRTKLKSFLKKIPKNFDIAFLGYHDDFSFRSKPLYRVGLHAYVINLQRYNLINFLLSFYNALPIDYMIWLASSNLNCYYNKKQILAINEEFRDYKDFDKNLVDTNDLKIYKDQIQRFFENYFKQSSNLDSTIKGTDNS